jgi:hypothetical protein
VSLEFTPTDRWVDDGLLLVNDESSTSPNFGLEIPQNKISDVNRLPYGHSKIIKLEKLGTSLNSGLSTEQAPTTDSYLCYAYTHFL